MSWDDRDDVRAIMAAVQSEFPESGFIIIKTDKIKAGPHEGQFATKWISTHQIEDTKAILKRTAIIARSKTDES